MTRLPDDRSEPAPNFDEEGAKTMRIRLVGQNRMTSALDPPREGAEHPVGACPSGPPVWVASGAGRPYASLRSSSWENWSL